MHPCRSELVHMLDQLTGEMRDTVTSRDLATPPLPQNEQPINALPAKYGHSSLPLALPQPELLTQAGPSNYSAPAVLTDGRSASNFQLLDGGQEMATGPIRTGSSGLLLVDTQTPPGLYTFTATKACSMPLELACRQAQLQTFLAA